MQKLILPLLCVLLVGSIADVGFFYHKYQVREQKLAQLQQLIDKALATRQ